MKISVVLAMLLVIGSPACSLASRDHRPVGKVLDTVPPRNAPQRRSVDHRHDRHQPQGPGFSDDSDRRSHPAKRFPHRPGQRRPIHVWPSGTTSVVREIQPIVIVAPPMPEPPPSLPEPAKVWVPPVMDTRIEPGYWDYAIRKVWMGDHWRYEQDKDRPKWVPERRVEFVKQEGYWKVVDVE